MITRRAEKEMGIPQEGDKRLDFCVRVLFRFDLSCMLLAEKAFAWFDTGMSIDGLARTTDQDPMIRDEINST